MTETQDTVLMAKEDWYLIQGGDSVVRRYNLHSYIVHTCGDRSLSFKEDGYHQYWWNLDFINTKCYRCDGYPPESIMGVWKLHNWEYIQAGGHA